MKKFIEIVCSGNKEARLYKGRPLADIPKSYKKIKGKNGIIYHNIGNNYNSHHLQLYRAKDKSLRYEIYRDGCFYPYYGKFEWVKVA